MRLARSSFFLGAGMAAAAEGQKEPRKEKVDSPGAPVARGSFHCSTVESVSVLKHVKTQRIIQASKLMIEQMEHAPWKLERCVSYIFLFPNIFQLECGDFPNCLT